MNFEQLRLQIHMRGLYERLGAMDAELLIVDAFLREQARHDTMLQQQAQLRKTAAAGIPSVETRDSISKQQVL
jgi:hypothetical protein